MNTGLVGFRGRSIFDARSVDDLAEHLLFGEAQWNGLVTSLNLEKIIAGGEPLIFERFIVDGVGAVIYGWMGGRFFKRVPGVDLFHSIIGRAAQYKRPIFFLGGTQKVNRAVQLKFRQQGGIPYGCNGFDFDFECVLHEIMAVQPRVVFVAMGSPLQEIIAAQLYERYPSAVYIGVGGSFDVYSGLVRRCPKILRTVGLEWLYRMCNEPHRVLRFISNIAIAVQKQRK